MKKNLTAAVLPVLSLLFVLAAVAFSFAANSTPTLAAPSNSAQASPGYAPLGWTGLLQVSRDFWYDNTSSIAASPLNLGVTIAWEERDEGQAHTFGAIKHASNTSIGASLNEQDVSRNDWKNIGNVVVRADALGRKHMTFFEYNGSASTCGMYAMVAADGNLATVESIPNSCNDFFKRTALAVGPDNSVHIVLGRDNQNLRYFHRTVAGQWDVQNEVLFNEVNTNDPSGPTLAVSTQGVVMAAWQQRPNGGGTYDIVTGKRSGPGQWVYENISAACCTGCSFSSNTYAPSIAADRVGGLRVAWVEEQCAPRTDPRSTDLYYREWTPTNGWNNQPIVLVDGSGGQQFWAAITVDNTGKAHIGYASDTDRGRDNYTFAYASGSGTSFTAPERPYISSGGFLKEPAIAHGPGYVFASFNSNIGAQQFKTVYYAYRDIVDTGGATPTPVATSTPVPPRCGNERFTDVCPGDFFYTSTLELDRRGVLGGYNSVPPCDGPGHIPCFKPFNNITRAQAAKVIVLAANLPANLEGAPHFQDVANTNTFYTFIEYAYNAGIITGYACGSVGEPCVGPENRPYFRPGNNVTRGQLSKMVALAFNLNEPVTGQTFEDVPLSSPFYLHVERLARRGIVSGYPCGSVGEPCLPGNRPYFRPNNNVTRGQASKIIYETILDTEPEATNTAEATMTTEATNTAVITATPTMMSTSTATSIIPTITITIPAGR